MSELVVEYLDQNLSKYVRGNVKESCRPAVRTRRLVWVHGLERTAQVFGREWTVQRFALFLSETSSNGSNDGSATGPVQRRSVSWSNHDVFPVRRKTSLDFRRVGRRHTVDCHGREWHFDSFGSTEKVTCASLVVVGVKVELLIQVELPVLGAGSVEGLASCINDGCLNESHIESSARCQPLHLEAVECVLHRVIVLAMADLEALLHSLQPAIPLCTKVLSVVRAHLFEKLVSFGLDRYNHLRVLQELAGETPVASIWRSLFTGEDHFMFHV